MAEDISVALDNITHVIIHANGAPPLKELLAIEFDLVISFKCEITTLFSCRPGLGVLVPCPFGFQLPPGLPDDARLEVIGAAVDRVLEEASGPFRDFGKAAIRERRQRATEMRAAELQKAVDLKLFDDARDLAAKPTSPEEPMTTQGLRALDKAQDEAANEPDDEVAEKLEDLFYAQHTYSAADRDEDDDGARKQLGEGEVLMSYNDRLRETEAVIEALGGVSQASGVLCFKVSETLGARALSMAKNSIWRYSEAADDPLPKKIRRLHKNGLRILILHY